MGNVSSRSEDVSGVYLRDQTRLALSSLIVTNSKRRILLNITPNTFPATRITAARDTSDNDVVDFVQDPEALSIPTFILKLSNEDELIFNFTFTIRQAQQTHQQPGPNDPLSTTNAVLDTVINGLTYVAASTPREVENLVTREFHADPNLHKNANVELVGDYSTMYNSSVSFDWSWKWKPPKQAEDRGGGWRNTCSFVEYDQRAHRLNTLATFSFWVSNASQALSGQNSPSPTFNLMGPPRLRVPSSQSVDSRISASEGRDWERPVSPIGLSDSSPFPLSTPVDHVRVDVSCQRPGEDMSATEDGPLFRATMKSLEQKTGNLRARMKKVLRKAEAAHQAQIDCNEAVSGFMEALREASSSNANAVQPALEHYFDKIAVEILQYEKQNTANLQKIIIDPMSKLYQYDIKQAEAKKRAFEDESKDYYAYVSRYLGQRQDSLKEKKRADSDTKYQAKRRTFELKRFDYSSFMQDLHGGRKEQEVLSQLTKYADAQTKSYLEVAKKVEEMLPQLDALSTEVKEADKEFQYQRTEREEKRRTLEKAKANYPLSDSDSIAVNSMAQALTQNGSTSYASDSDIGRADSTGSTLKVVSTNGTTLSTNNAGIADLSRSPGSLGSGTSIVGSPNNRFRGIRDLEDRDSNPAGFVDKSGTQRKEGLLWALSRPGSLADPKGLNKQAWHKFWIVLDQGKLSEYSNWKQKLDLHMEPIDLRMASVREARNSERRFCFEVITPQYKRVYQATSEEDLSNWISAINNALQSAMEGRGLKDIPVQTKSQTEGSSLRRDIGSILTGKSSSLNYGYHHQKESSYSSASNKDAIIGRRTTVGARPTYGRTASSNIEEQPDKLLQLLRNTDQGNRWCADCGSDFRTDWVSINLAVILCIECSGIHRSLGTHVSKIRSLTLDVNSFSTDIVEALLLVGNRVANMIWEARLDTTMKPVPQATREQRLRYITSKYVDAAYVEPISSTLSRFGTADETLLAAIKKNDIQQVIYALALKANPNVTDRSRATPGIFLALAAADPASPSQVASPMPPGTTEKVVPFPVAELLAQNGAEIPTTLPAFPLSRGALLYIDQKSGRLSTASQDTVSALPQLSPNDRPKEREGRLQKRMSAGGRLARSPIPER